MRRAVLLLSIVVVAMAPIPAHADPEIDVIECSGTIDGGAVTTPGFHEVGGLLSCALSHGGNTGLEKYEGFTSPVTGYVDNVADVPGAVYQSSVYLTFSGATTDFSLGVYDRTVAGTMAMVNPDNTVRANGPRGSNDFHVRAGLISDPLPGLVGTAGNRSRAAAPISEEVHFVAEYVSDI